MIARHLICAGAAALLAQAAPATAQDTTNADTREASQLRQEMIELQSRLERLEAQLKAQQASVEAGQPASEPDDDKTAIEWKGAPELSTESGWSFKPRGRLHYDFGIVSAPDAISDSGLGFSNELRRARLGVEGDIPGGFGYRVEFEFAGGEAELYDGYLTYGDGALKLTAGQHNNFQSLEELTSSNDTSFVERAAFTDAFGFERRIGVSAQYSTGPLLLQGGVFTDNAADLDDDGNDTVGVDGRAVFAPKLGSAQLHFGGSAHWRDLGDTTTSTRYRQRPLIHSTDIRFVDTGDLASARSETHYGLEALAISGRYHIAGEVHWLQLSRDAAPDAGFLGGYAEVGYFLTEDSYGYRGGVLRAPKVKKPVGDGGFGAIALSLRYDRLDLTDTAAGVFGGKQDGFIAGISWWPVDNLRFILDYAHLEYDDATILAGGDRSYAVDVIGGRAQVSF